MTIYEITVAGHCIKFADDGWDQDESTHIPCWKTKVDHGMWSAGRPSLSIELQSAIDDVLYATADRGKWREVPA